MDEAIVTIRPYEPQIDDPFIFASWRNSSFYGLAENERGMPKDWFREKTKEIRKILDDPAARVRVACLKDAPEVIIGWAVRRVGVLEWAYVKALYRGKGVGRLLLRRTDE